MSMKLSPAVVPDMNEAIRRMVERYHAIPETERKANLKREAAIRASLRQPVEVAA